MNSADRLSKLPKEITELILTCLPLRDAVRMSILSKEWRYKWTTIPSLVFSPNDCCPPSCNDKALIRTKLAGIFNHVLLHHSGSIQVFKAKNICLTPCIESWIHRVSTRSIKELVLANDTEKDFACRLDDEFELPCSLYACDRLTRLSLSQCKMKPPPAFKGFMGLKPLHLQRVVFSNDDAFESLISGCPLLENLTLCFLDGVKNLKVHAPNLQNLKLFGDFEDISFGDTHVKLLSVIIEGCYRYCYIDHEKVNDRLTQFFSKLPNIKTFVAVKYSMKYFCSEWIPERLPTPCFGLHTLSLCMDVSDVMESLAALCILRSSPNLEVLHIVIEPCDDEEGPRSDWLDEKKGRCALDKLRTAYVMNIRNVREELGFIKFMLMNSPALEMMYIYGCNLRQDNTDSSVFQEIQSFRQASTRAEVVFSPHYHLQFPNNPTLQFW